MASSFRRTETEAILNACGWHGPERGRGALPYDMFEGGEGNKNHYVKKSHNFVLPRFFVRECKLETGLLCRSSFNT